MCNSQPSESQRPIVGATSLILLEMELEEARHLVSRLRVLGRSEHLPERARQWLNVGADHVGGALLLGSLCLQELEEKHPAEAQAADRMGRELEWTEGGES